MLALGFAIGRKRTLAALRRSYERQTGQTIEESSLYKRFSPGRARPLKKRLARAFEELAVACGLEGPLVPVCDV